MRFSPRPQEDAPSIAPRSQAPQSGALPVSARTSLSQPSLSQPSLSQPKASMRRTALQRFWGAWLRLAAPPLHDRDPDSPKTRMIERRRAIASSLLFGLVLLWTLLLPVNIALYSSDLRTTLLVIAIGYLTLMSVGWLIRRGWVTVAAIALIGLIFLGFVAIQLSDTHDALERSSSFYILLYPILLAAILMPADALFVTLLACLLLLGWSTLTIWPASIRLESLAAPQFTDIYIWPIATLVIVAIVAYIWTSGMQRATTQAEFAKLNAMLSQMSEMSAREALEHDVRELIRVIDAWSSDNLGAQAGPLASPDLRRVAIALTSYASRVRTLAKNEFDLRREREAVRRIAEAILYSRQGVPVAWPAPTGLPADLIIQSITTQDPQAALAMLSQDYA
jgi:hypothetical protein